MASCATVTPPTNPAHYTHGGPAAAPLVEVSRSVRSSRGAVDAVRFSAARQFSPGARIAQAAEQGRKYLRKRGCRDCRRFPGDVSTTAKESGPQARSGDDPAVEQGRSWRSPGDAGNPQSGLPAWGEARAG